MRRNENKFRRGEFIAWDGEGATVNGEHRYVLLANSLGHYIFDPRGIPTKDCLEFLSLVGRMAPAAIHVCFGASYDVNMILRDLTRPQLARLWHASGSQSASFLDWRLQYRPRKEFVVNDGTTRVSLWDVFGFFQSSFVEALTANLGADYPDLELIKAGKARRSQFSPKERDNILTYCQAELRALVALMKHLRQSMMTADIEVRRWDGAGAIAAALLEKFHIVKHKADTPFAVTDAAASAYAGGRIEILRYGYYSERVSHADIQSAYPAGLLHIPSLSGGRWERVRGSATRQSFSVSLVRWDFDQQKAPQLYPYFYREVDGSIIYPAQGLGWHWEPEVNAAEWALNKGHISGSHEILETWNFYPHTTARPFYFIPPLYWQRKEWKKAGNGAEKVTKLGLNSLYGKLAQRIGAVPGKRPTYHQLEWAGYVTAYTRARLYRAVAPIREHIIMLATDGIYATTEIPELDIGPGVGQWEADTRDSILVAQSGVYWCWPEPEKHFFCRGFDKGSLDHTKILSAYRQHRRTYTARMTRFVTIGTALMSASQFRKWRTWDEAPRELALDTDGTKRTEIDLGGLSPWNKYPPHKTLVPTNAKQNHCPDYPSTPYDVPWLKKEREDRADLESELEWADTLV